MKAFSIFLLVCAGILGCSDNSPESVENFTTDFDEEKMEKAIAEAKKNLPQFIAALKSPPPLTESFVVKKAFPYGDEDGQEYIWLNEVELTENGFLATVNNVPVFDVKVDIGDRLEVSFDEVEDWMFIVNGQLKGGYTIIALIHGTPKEDAYNQQMKINWDVYQFIKE